MILLCLFVLSSLFRPLVYHMGKMRHAWRLEKTYRPWRSYQPSEQARVFPVRFNLLFIEFLSLTIPLFPSKRKLQRNLQKPNPTQSINHMEKSSKATPTMLKSWVWWYDLFYSILHATRLKEQVKEKIKNKFKINKLFLYFIYLIF